jgi:hypothetical protein
MRLGLSLLACVALAGCGSATQKTDGSDGSDGTVPACTSATADSPAMAAADFCAIFLDTCSGVADFTIPAGFTTTQMCTSSYAALSDSLRMCRSYHLCNAISTGDPMPHCQHAVGIGACFQ